MPPVAGGVSAQPLAQGQAPNKFPDQLSAQTTLLQAGGGGFARIINALQLLDQSGAVINLAANITALQGQVTTLQGQVATLQGQVTTLQGQVAAQQQTINSFNWVQAEVNTGLTFLDSRTLYTRSFVISSALATANNTTTFAHGVPNINYIAQVIAVAGINSGFGAPIFYGNTSAPLSDAIGIWADTVNIYVSNGTVIRTSYLVLVKLYYTATDR